MKKVILGLVLIVMCCACTTALPANSLYKQKIVYNDQEKVTYIYEYDEGTIVKETKNGEVVLENTVDENGRVVETNYIDGEKVTYEYQGDYLIKKISNEGDKSEYFYDDLGNEVKSIQSIDGELITAMKEYQGGLLAVVKYYAGAENEFMHCEEYKYNENGDLIEILSSDHDGNIVNKKEFIVENEKIVETKEYVYTEDEEMVYTTRFEYDQNNNLMKEYLKINEGEEKLSIEYIYK